jgi:hypothetical protein
MKIIISESEKKRILNLYEQTEQWVRLKDPIGYWKVLYNRLQEYGINVKWQVPNDPASSAFMYWGGWVIWKNSKRGNGYNVWFIDKENNVEMGFKFDGGKYIGQAANKIILNPSSINATFNLGEFGKLKNETISDTIKKYKKTNPLGNSNLVLSAYEQLIDAVKGIGTNPNIVLSAIKKLKTENDFKYFLTLFKDKKTGYTDFFDMINKEYEMDNADDLGYLIAALNKINVFTTANFATNGFGQSVFVGYFRLRDYYKPSTDIREKCETKWRNFLPSAIKWWRDWLSDPITKEKVYKNYLVRSENEKGIIDDAFVKYFELLDKIVLRFYDKTTVKTNDTFVHQDAGGFVTKPDGNIYIKCDQIPDDDYAKTLLVHEIQHMIYYIKPLNPDKNVGDSFNNANCNYESESTIKNTLVANSVNRNFSENIIRAAKEIDVDPSHLSLWEMKKEYRKMVGDPGYFCRETEKMSNISALRRLLNLKPGENITLSMIKPFITGDKFNVDVEFIIYCWIEKGYPNLSGVLNNINQLALNNNIKSQENIT